MTQQYELEHLHSTRGNHIDSLFNLVVYHLLAVFINLISSIKSIIGINVGYLDQYQGNDVLVTHVYQVQVIVNVMGTLVFLLTVNIETM